MKTEAETLMPLQAKERQGPSGAQELEQAGDESHLEPSEGRPCCHLDFGPPEPQGALF